MSNRRHASAGESLRLTKKYNLLQKLHFRQLHGSVRQHGRAPKMRLFNHLPSRLAFPLSKMAPLSALAAGHIFLGFTKCGQFLLSYTHSYDTDEITLQMTHRYRLHWWLVVPYAPLKKVAEMMLFGDQEIQENSYDNLSITICQWPNDLAKILVYGCSLGDDGDALGSSSNRRCHLTITAVPSLDACAACHKVANSFEDEEVAERWNSCIRLSCLQHAYTVHTSFDMVPPYPRFLPTVQLKYKDWVVLNSGNFIHVLHVSLENAHRCSSLVSNSWNSVLYQNRLNSMTTSAGTTPMQEEHDDIRIQSPPTATQFQSYNNTNETNMRRNFVSDRISAVNTRALLHQQEGDYIDERSSELDIGGESSSSDTELEANNSTRVIIDRRVLTEADRDREWEILISNVPPRTSLSIFNESTSNAVDTDSASDVEIATNDGSGLSDISMCTVKDISVRFDMLKHGDIVTDITSSIDNNVTNYLGTPSVTTRSKAIQRLNFQSKQISVRLSSTNQPSQAAITSSNESYSCNDDSDDSSIYIKPCDKLKTQEDNNDGPSVSGQIFSIPNENCRTYTGRRFKRARSIAVTRFTRSRSEDSHSEQEENLSLLRSRTLPRHSSDTTPGSVSPPNAADNEYEFVDEIVGSRHEKLSVFRKRRLADKKYEFSDENSENVPENYHSFRKQRTRHNVLDSVLVVPSPAVSPRDFNSKSAAVVAMETGSSSTADSAGLMRSVYERLLSPASGMTSPNDVLRPINQNISSPILSPRDDRWSYDSDRYEKGGLQQFGSRENLSMLGFSPNHPTSRSTPSALLQPQSPVVDVTVCADVHAAATVDAAIAAGEMHGLQSLNCVVDINRCYIEVDDELVSIITDIEDDELSNCTGYHNALPLEVHGAGYTQMHMISNSKAEKLLMPCVKVRQLSLDVEQFCHGTAHALCIEANKRYSCCSDYNVEIADVCSNTGNIVAIASVLVQADTIAPSTTTTTTPSPAASPPKTRNTRRNNSGSGAANNSGNGGSNSFLSGNSFLNSNNVVNVDVPPYSAGVRKLYKASSTFVFNILTKQHYVLDKQPLLEEDPFHLSCHDGCGESCEQRCWWQAGSVQARKLRALATHPTSYYSSVKVLTNHPFLRGNSLTHIMEGQHLMAIVLGPIPRAAS